ncbi:Uncharacterised protein [Dermatophilus congolensis]|uniref:Uncharacterized protein n=1 Tax=Dermatophilus congolensis TaxID=1863 RepID=A0AA46BLF1_9MICO|nr:hypothetical protein [Dermatophilus congolensis]STD04094.1 Uncharacterised protein [Dermatophilus congolensis]
MKTIVVADQKAGLIHLYDPTSNTWSTPLEDTVLAEHAGLLHLPDGRIAFADDANGELVLLDPATPENPTRIAIAIPGEHIATDPHGHYIGVSTGLGASFTPSSDQLTLIDLTTPRPRARRVRTRSGEPGITLTDTAAILRHREPGALQRLTYTEITDAGPHVPQVTGTTTEDIDSTGHGDAHDTTTHTIYTATARGLETHNDTTLAPGPIHPWGDPATNPGRAYFLRHCPHRRIIAAVCRHGGDNPRAWHTWTNNLWILDLDTGTTRTTDLGPGLVFRFALTPTALVASRIHPDGDELTAHTLTDLTLRGRWELPPLEHGPKPGREPWDAADRRATAADPTGETAIVTRGGHGQIHIIDTSSPENPITTCTAPSALRDGGHLGWFDDAIAPQHRDRVGR